MLSWWTRGSVALICIALLYGCTPKQEAPVAVQPPPGGTNLPVPAMAAINTQKREMLERQIKDVQGNTQLPAEMKAKAIADLNKQLAELPGK